MFIYEELKSTVSTYMACYLYLLLKEKLSFSYKFMQKASKCFLDRSNNCLWQTLCQALGMCYP